MAKRETTMTVTSGTEDKKPAPKADKKYITTKYGTRINVSNLTPEQVTKVRSMAEDRGAYGTKGANLADEFRKRNAKSPAGDAGATGGDGAPANSNPPGAAIDPNSGQVDPTKLFEEAPQLDTTNDFTAPNLTPTPDYVTAEDLAGASSKAQNANYNYITRNYGKSKEQEVADKKQELAERGIPLDPNPDSLYGRSLKAIDDKYQSLDDQANNQAIMAGNETLQTQAGISLNAAGMQNQAALGASGQANDFTLGAAGTSNQAFTSFMNAALGMSQSDLTKYGIDQNMILALKQLKQQKNLEQQKINIAGRAPAAKAAADNTGAIVMGGDGGWGISNG